MFPVQKGTEVVVDCVEGYTLTSGERTLTCVQDAEYTVWRNFPSCTIGRWDFSYSELLYELILQTLVKLLSSCLLNNFDIFAFGHFNFI